MPNVESDTRAFDQAGAAGPTRELAKGCTAAGDADTPFARAARLIESAAALTPEAWDDVSQRAHAVEPAAYTAAVRRLGAILVGHPQSRALAALHRAASDAPTRTAKPLPHITAEQACSYAGRVTAHAAFAIALAPELGPDAVAVLTAPMARILGPSTTGARSG